MPAFVQSPDCSANDRLALAASVFAHTRNGVMITALDGSILAVNPAFTVITGYSEDEVLGKNPRILKSGRQGADFYKDMWDSIRLHGFWNGEAWNRRKDGAHFAENITVTMVPDAHGHPSHYIAVFSDVTKMSERRRWLEQKSYFDTLTGLPNRVFLMERLTKAIEESKASGVPLAVAFIDLDGFKEVNDKFGHAAGDNLLVQTAGRLAQTIRASDTLARFGGDEFIAVLPDLRNDSILPVLMQRFLDASSHPLELEGIHVRISASIGVAILQADAYSPEELLKAADSAMYVAKREGRNCYRVYRSGLFSL